MYHMGNDLKIGDRVVIKGVGPWGKTTGTIKEMVVVPVTWRVKLDIDGIENCEITVEEYQIEKLEDDHSLMD